MLKKQVMGWAIVWKNNGELLEAYAALGMHSIFEEKKQAILELKERKWPNYTKDLVIIPCIISYKPPVKSK